MVVKQFGTMDGVACLVRKEAEGSGTVLRFRFDRGDGILHPIELRGDAIRGDLESGDKVEVSIKEKDVGETTIRLKRIVNLSTGYSVEVWDKSQFRRVGSFISENAITAAIATLVTAGVSFVLAVFEGIKAGVRPRGVIINPGVTSNGKAWYAYAALAAAFNVAAFVILYWHLGIINRRRNIKRHLWPYLRSRRMVAISGGLLAGELLTTLILWITHTAL